MTPFPARLSQRPEPLTVSEWSIARFEQWVTDDDHGLTVVTDQGIDVNLSAAIIQDLADAHAQMDVPERDVQTFGRWAG